MPTHVSLTTITQRRTAHRLESVPGGLLPLLVFSLIGIIIDGLAVLGAYGRQGLGSTGLVLIVAAPALAAAAALCVAGLHGRPADRRR
jgi:hypothetical protein